MSANLAAGGTQFASKPYLTINPDNFYSTSSMFDEPTASETPNRQVKVPILFSNPLRSSKVRRLKRRRKLSFTFQ